MEDFEKELEGFEILLEDPSVTEIVTKARLTNEYLITHPMSEKEGNKALTELNEDWESAELTNKRMFVTGDAWSIAVGFKVEHDKQINEDAYTRFINQECIMGGFTFIENIQIDDDGVRSTQELFLNVKSLIEEEGREGNASQVDFIISLKNNTDIMYEGSSPQRAEKWLDLYYPEEKAEIAQICQNTSDEAQAILGLQNLSVSIENLDKKETKELKKNLEVFTKNLLNVEMHVPYLFETYGTIKVIGWTKKAHKKYIDTTDPGNGQGFINIYDIFFEKSDDKQHLEPLIFGGIVGRKASDLTVCKIPFKELYRIESFRTIVNERNEALSEKSTE
jgi:hypothetical protein